MKNVFGEVKKVKVGAWWEVHDKSAICIAADVNERNIDFLVAAINGFEAIEAKLEKIKPILMAAREAHGEDCILCALKDTSIDKILAILDEEEK